MAGYPVTVSLRWETYVAVVKDIVLSLRRQARDPVFRAQWKRGAKQTGYARAFG